jgi:hypothetical protein
MRFLLFTVLATLLAIVVAIPITPSAPRLQKRAEQFRLQGLREVRQIHKFTFNTSTNLPSSKSPRSSPPQQQKPKPSANASTTNSTLSYTPHPQITTSTSSPATSLPALWTPHQCFPKKHVNAIRFSDHYVYSFAVAKTASATRARKGSCDAQRA